MPGAGFPSQEDGVDARVERDAEDECRDERRQCFSHAG
jgi:hypothetical protein